MRKLIPLLICLLGLFISCSEEKEKVSYSDEAFIDILFDINVARKAVSTESLNHRDSLLRIYLGYVARRHDTDTLTINRNIAMLMKNEPNKMIAFLDSVDKRVDVILEANDMKYKY